MSTPATGKQIGRIPQLLEKIARETARPVSPRWIRFSKRLRVARGGIMKWIDFVRLAVSCGVGVPRGGGIKSEVDLEMCCDFLSDTGSIIHFRHPLWSNSSPQNLSQFVVINPGWFNQLSYCLTAFVGSRGLAVDTLQKQRYKALTTIPPVQHRNGMVLCAKEFLNDQGDLPGLSSSWKSSLLQGLHLGFTCEDIPYLSFCLLPDWDNPNSSVARMIALWRPNTVNLSPSKDKTIVNGRCFQLSSIHEGILPQLMNMLQQLQGVQPEVFWKTGLRAVNRHVHENNL
ncbi:hypothetical protein Pelo_19389 [Pelomyxa schiedti]|nr:hypothetical protein Pelo_19389 [Pelomyxa schiedti]